VAKLNTGTYRWPSIFFGESAARRFALLHDRNPAHIGDVGNMVLPKGTLSGLFVLSEVNNLLLDLDRYGRIQCATKCDVIWLSPLYADHEYELSATWRDSVWNRNPGLARRKCACRLTDKLSLMPVLDLSFNHIVNPTQI
jgi:hypothetical protein